jgi:hypothetical protein
MVAAKRTPVGQNDPMENFLDGVPDSDTPKID